MNKIPKFIHHCNSCIFLGSEEYNHKIHTVDTFVVDTQVKINYFDLYWCQDKKYPLLTSIVIGRFGNDECEYFSSHLPIAFTEPNEYLKKAGKWYISALKLAEQLGLYDSKTMNVIIK